MKLNFSYFLRLRAGLIFVASQTSNFSQTFFKLTRASPGGVIELTNHIAQFTLLLGTFAPFVKWQAAETASCLRGLWDGLWGKRAKSKNVDNGRQCNEKGKNAFSKIVLPVPKNRSQQALRHDWNGLLRDKNRLKRWVKDLDNKAIRLSGQWIHFMIVNKYVNERPVWAAFLSLLSDARLSLILICRSAISANNLNQLVEAHQFPVIAWKKGFLNSFNLIT